jgi:hypothetical protein
MVVASNGGRSPCSGFPKPPASHFSQLQLSAKVKVILLPTVSRPVCLGVKPHLGHKTRFLLLSDIAGLFMWGALSDERTGLSFTIPANPQLKVEVTLRLAVYRQSVRLGDKPLETHDQNFYFPTEHLRL